MKANLIDALKTPAFDPNREYSAPWQSGMTGLIYRKDKVAKPESINAIFDPKLKGKVTMLTEMRDTVGLTMLGMGMDPAKATLDQANQALDKIDKANRDGQIRRFTGNDYIRDLPKGDTYMCYGWSGDATVRSRRSNPNIEFVFPDEGVMIWADNMQIPIGAPHAWTAEVFMNYVYDPEVAAPLAEAINYVTPVKGVKEVLAKKDPKLAENQFIFPDAETLATTHLFNELSPTGRGGAERALPEDHRGLATAVACHDRVASGRDLDSGRRSAARVPHPAPRHPVPAARAGPAVAGDLLRRAAVLHGAAVARERHAVHRLRVHVGVLELHGRDLRLQRAADPLVPVRGDLDRCWRC